MEVELLYDSKCNLGEGPVWDHKSNIFYWVDILEKCIFMYDPSNDKVRTTKLDQYVGCVAPRKNGGLVMGLKHGFYFYDWKQDQLEKIHDPESHLTENRFNDGKCDPTGRFWAGTTDATGEDGDGALYLLDKDLTVSKKIENVGTSNGIAWSPDHRFMYFIDTPTKQVVRYDFDITKGTIHNPNVVIDFPVSCGLPDGMTIDQEGMLWIAGWGGKGVSRWNPYTGDKLEFIPVPAVNVTSCTFGGEEMDELYITTARTRTTEEDLQKYPHAGGVFKVKTGVKGCLNYSFG